MSGFYKGVAAEQETLYVNADKKLMRTIKFPESFNERADMKRVNLEVLKPWIAKRIVELIGFEDEVVIDFVYSMLEEAAEEAAKSDDPSQTHTLDPRKLQLNLTGFLESNAPKFVEELWELILSASKNEYGIPQKMIEEKKAELERSRQARKEQRVVPRTNERERDYSHRHDERQGEDRYRERASSRRTERSHGFDSYRPHRDRGRSGAPYDSERRHSRRSRYSSAERYDEFGRERRSGRYDDYYEKRDSDYDRDGRRYSSYGRDRGETRRYSRREDDSRLSSPVRRSPSDDRY